MLDASLTRRSSGAAKQSGRDTGRLLLERASVRMSLGDFVGSVQDFDQADRLLDTQALGRSRYLTRGFNPKAMVYMYERGWQQALNLPYGAKFYERLLLNPLAALCRLELGDATGACIEARRFGVMSDWTEQVAAGRAKPVRAFGELISALACTPVDASLACSSLSRAARLVPELAHDTGISCVGPAAGSGRLSVLIGYGRPSHPQSPPEKPDSVTLVAGPEAQPEQVALRIDGQQVEARELLDVDAAVRADYYEGEHALSMRLLGETAYGGGWSDVAWEGLPAHVHFATLELAPGLHQVSVEVRGQRRSRVIRLVPQQSRSVWFGSPW